ncbi:MAG TPA: molybdopterin cofactor-binding domain-containing protein [Candidatus Limnocylindrales bacterium]|nr:molybdopterin cofactor-binding domain-containing protein [Candidatus Limnocylindrales bacterium]
MTAAATSRALADYPRIGSWLDLDGHGRVTVYSGKVEYGQGIWTALAQLVAHELAVPIERVTMASVDTIRSPDEGVTSGSRSIEEANEGLRMAAAELRAALCRRAATRLGVPAELLTAQMGGVVAPDGRRIEYGELADERLGREGITGSVALRPADGASPLGASVARSDLPAKVTGQPAFLQDIELPGMLHGRILRPPGVDAQLVALDEEAVLGMPGVHAVVRDGSFVGVVAEREEQAIRALARLRRVATWTEDGALPASPRFMLDEPTLDVIVHERGQSVAPIAGEQEVRAEYSRPYLAHASLAPSCAIASFVGDAYEIWSHSQGIYHLRGQLAKVLQTDAERIRVRHAEGAGCYGANGADDVALDAALLARAVPGRAVRVQWMREDEFAWEPFGTAMFVRLAARLGPDGRVVEWLHDVWGNGHRDRAGSDAPATVTNLLAARHLAEPLSPSVAPSPPSPGSGGGRNAAPPYAFPNQRIVNHYVARTPLRVSALRSLGAHANVFASESFMDEIAALVGTDPVAHRLGYLDDPRAREVVERAAALAGWERRARREDGRGLGIGFARYKSVGCYVAVVAEVEIDRDLRLTRVWAAVDAGLVVNPDGLANQAEGGITQAASWTLTEEVQFDAARVTTRDWTSYPIMGFVQAPEVHVELIPRDDEPPAGAGEAFAGPTAAAIGNAIYDATGVRLRDMPFTRERLMRALA